MRRIVRLVIVLSVLAAFTAPAAVAAERMWIGFHDDPSFRWVGDRKAVGAMGAEILSLSAKYGLPAYEGYAAALYDWANGDVERSRAILHCIVAGIVCTLIFAF